MYYFAIGIINTLKKSVLRVNGCKVLVSHPEGGGRDVVRLLKNVPRELLGSNWRVGKKYFLGRKSNYSVIHISQDSVDQGADHTKRPEVN